MKLFLKKFRVRLFSRGLRARPPDTRADTRAGRWFNFLIAYILLCLLLTDLRKEQASEIALH
jgi:hypothetical protein